MIGMVAAEDLRTARARRCRRAGRWELLPTLFSPDARSLQARRACTHRRAGNVAYEESLAWGDVARGLAEADFVFEETFTSPTIYHHPIEPAMSIVVNYTTQGIEIWSPSNNPFDVIREMAEVFGIPPERVRVHVPYSAATLARSTARADARGGRPVDADRPPGEVRRHRRGELSGHRPPRHGLSSAGSA